ncbi:MAG: hypothetical protein SFT93_03245, partial [Rickettsiaceae bacterium]|nr:hypothetical protein [Rickettsiaceae bacterium]
GNDSDDHSVISRRKRGSRKHVIHVKTGIQELYILDSRLSENDKSCSGNDSYDHSVISRRKRGSRKHVIHVKTGI